MWWLSGSGPAHSTFRFQTILKLKRTPLKAGLRDKEQEQKPKMEQQPSNNFVPSRNSSLVWGGEADSELTQASLLSPPLCGSEIRRINERVEKTEKERTQTEERLVKLAWCSQCPGGSVVSSNLFYFIFFYTADHFWTDYFLADQPNRGLS